jgi:hypothetical protein
MVRNSSERERPQLAVPRHEAEQRILKQIERASTLPSGASINEHCGARQWYEFTAELLRQFFTTDEPTDEFTGRGSFWSGDDISVGRYLEKLMSIHQRLELYSEKIQITSNTSLVDPLPNLERLVVRFHSVARQLRQRYVEQPTLDISDEYDVQDLFHAMLRLFFDDIRPEEWTPSYAGGSSRMDFLLKSEKIVVEVKKTRPKLGAREVGEQLATDILRYRSHPDCRTLICFIYDPEERIANPRGLEQDLNQLTGELQVRVFVAQK